MGLTITLIYREGRQSGATAAMVRQQHSRQLAEGVLSVLWLGYHSCFAYVQT